MTKPSLGNFIDRGIVSIGLIVFSVTEEISVSRRWESIRKGFDFIKLYHLSSESSSSSSSTGSSASKLEGGGWSRRGLFGCSLVYLLPFSLFLSRAASLSRSSKSLRKSRPRNSSAVSCPACLKIHYWRTLILWRTESRSIEPSGNKPAVTPLCWK